MYIKIELTSVYLLLQLLMSMQLNPTGLVAASLLQTRQTREIIITDAVRRIQHDGYPVEKHSVKTKDGYVLTMHRIPQVNAQQHTVLQRPVVFMLSGLYASSDVWLLNGPDDSLAYLLWRNGYDVWLGNNRGNIYCRQNVWYNVTDRDFWNFSWHEISVYDMPAMIDYIIRLTGEPQMHFIGISQGGTVFLVLNSMMPQYNRVFKTATFLAPVAYVSNTRSGLAKLIGPILGTRNYISKLLEGVEMFSTNKFFKKFLSMACLEHENPHVCVTRLWPAVGYDTRFLNKTILPDLMANFPAGGSVKQLMHYFQGYVSTKFRQYDYGPEKNWLYYNQLEPPEYKLENVTTPISIYYSENDYIVAPEDIWRLVTRLPNVKAIYKIPWKRWNHFDFICGLGVRPYIFDNIVRSLNLYEFS